MVSPVLFLFACHPPTPCPTFAETQVVDETGYPGALEEVQAALADFAGWTSRAGVCVAELVIVGESPVDGTAGMALGDRIEVEPYTMDLRERTFHELCHAWDSAEGGPSLDHPDLFPLVPESELYPSERTRASEAFAEVCESGPRAVAERQFAADLCGEPRVLGDAEAWVRDHVYDAFVDVLDVEVGYAPVTVSSATLWSEGDVDAELEVAPAGERLAFLRWRYDTPPTLRLVDPVSLAVVELPLPTSDEVGASGLLGSDGDPVFWAADPLRIWRIDPANGAATPLIVDAPDLARIHGYVHGDTAWIQPLSSGETQPPFALNLTTGETSSLLAADGAPLAYALFFGNGDQVALNGGASIELWSFANGSWSTLPQPSILTTTALPLADGRLAGGYLLSMPAGGQRYVPLVADPVTQVYTMPDDACGAGNWDARGFGQIVTVGDTLYGLLPGPEVELVTMGF